MSTPERVPLDQARVIDTAAALADRDGIDAVTLTRVAEQLGVRQPALYRHVDSFDDLMRGLSLLGNERLADSIASAAIGLAGDDVVVAIGRTWRRVASEHPGLYAASGRHPGVGDRELDAVTERIVAIIRASLTGYELEPEASAHVAHTLRSAFHGFALLEAGGQPSPGIDLDVAFARMLDLLCTGIREQRGLP